MVFRSIIRHMKVYFTASSTGATHEDIRDIKTTLSILKEQKHTITNPFYKKVSLEVDGDLKVEISNSDISGVLMKQIALSDCVIAEISAPSVSLGIQIEFALGKKIPVLCLLKKGKKDGLPLLIRDYKHNLLTKRIYCTDELETVVTGFLANLPNAKVKFNMFIGFELDKYLTYISKKQNKPKSEIVRKLLAQKMASDNDYPTERA